jgi:secreted Zn-dependent insulinase-like peptidase
MNFISVGYFSNCEMFEYLLDLTQKGLDNIDKIIEAVFASINSAKSDPNIEEILDNIKTMEQKGFIFAEDKQTKFPDDIDNIMENFYLFGYKNILGNPVDKIFTKERALQILNDLSPDRSFILVDSSSNLNSKYLTSSELLFTRNYNLPYRINKIPDEIITYLKEVKSIDDYNFTLREKNDDFSKLDDLTEKPCYKKSPNKCQEFKEFDTSSNDMTPYVVKDEDNTLSLMKINRSFGVHFVKGYINIELDNDKLKELTNSIKKLLVIYY